MSATIGKIILLRGLTSKVSPSGLLRQHINRFDAFPASTGYRQQEIACRFKVPSNVKKHFVACREYFYPSLVNEPDGRVSAKLKTRVS
jgi:hypothetical protein